MRVKLCTYPLSSPRPALVTLLHNGKYERTNTQVNTITCWVTKNDGMNTRRKRSIVQKNEKTNTHLNATTGLLNASVNRGNPIKR